MYRVTCIKIILISTYIIDCLREMQHLANVDRSADVDVGMTQQLDNDDSD